MKRRFRRSPSNENLRAYFKWVDIFIVEIWFVALNNISSQDSKKLLDIFPFRMDLPLDKMAINFRVMRKRIETPHEEQVYKRERKRCAESFESRHFISAGMTSLNTMRLGANAFFLMSGSRDAGKRKHNGGIAPVSSPQGGFDGLSIPKQSSKPPKLKYEQL